MKERPILFNSEMVRSILEGRKTQTRRIVKIPSWFFEIYGQDDSLEDVIEVILRNQFGNKGDRLWVRESYSVLSAGNIDGTGKVIMYRADDNSAPFTWTPSIHMTRWASRITLEITNIRVERVQDISEEDAENEGLSEQMLILNKVPTLRDLFHYKFDEIYPGSWEENSWVWVISFKVVKP